MEPADANEDWESCEDNSVEQPSSSVQVSGLEELPKSEESVLGCSHYQRNCLVQAPCCRKYYWCKLCHDDLYKGPKSNWCETQRMEFEKVQKVKCGVCDHTQIPSSQCTQCKTIFGKYCCLKCKLYQNDPKWTTKIFHCDKCGMCRKGKHEDFKHCDKCGYCIPILDKDHKCMEIGQSECPVCLQVLKYSTQQYTPMKCGHLIHLKCLHDYMRTSRNCPLCGMAMYNMSANEIQEIETMIAGSQQLPPELKDKKVNVMCNQCLHKTMDAQFHFYGVKCGSCGTFNTKMM